MSAQPMPCALCGKLTMFRDTLGNAVCAMCEDALYAKAIEKPGAYARRVQQGLSYTPRTKNTAKFMKGTKR